MSTSSQPSLSSEIYGDAAGFGKIMSWIGAIVGTFIGIGMVIGGIILLGKKNKYSASTQATIDTASCSPYNDGQTTGYNCTLVVHYTVNGQVYNRTFTTISASSYASGQLVTISYNPDSPSDSQIGNTSTKVIGGVLLGFGLFILISAWVMVWLTMKYRFAAAAEGVSGAWSMLRNI